eukprot:TRINITY_DN63992_c0_g1_i1.p1 TRINITY_DN63992_c0_g1~~TRINITY_DN63992_c0_g1_i1.p1  ORF type:complete len:218 (+),score=51.85 TRINITY_DN63992_c0_g1_i1:39-656(+)
MATDEDAIEIARIKKATNYFEVLGLSLPEVTLDDVKRAHRKIVLKVHPDKCKHPEAADAFDELTKAFNLLNDEEVLQHFIDAFRHKDTAKGQQFRADAREFQKKAEERKRMREEGGEPSHVPSWDEQRAKAQKKADKTEKQLDEYRKKVEVQEEKRREDEFQKRAKLEEEKALRHTRTQWSSFLDKKGKAKNGPIKLPPRRDPTD